MATLPLGTPERAGYNETEKNSVIRTPMGYGPDKIRERTKAVLYNSVQNFTITGTEKTTLDAFYKDNKTVRFDWDNGIVGLQDYRFRAPPNYQSVSCDLWRVQLQLERLP